MVLLAPAAQAMPYFNNVYIFGDSLVDSGNLFDLTGGTIPPPIFGYFEGRISNGPSLGDWLTFYSAGEPLAQASRTGGNNYAYGDARIRDNSDDAGVGSDIVPDLAAQVLAYLTDNPGGPGEDDLIILNIGGNDIRDLGSTVPVDLMRTPESLIAEAAMILTEQIVTLELAGAQNILLMSVPDAGRAPEAQAGGPGAVAAARGAAIALQGAIELGLSLRPTTSDLRIFNSIPFTDALVADPAAFGLPADINLSGTCIGTLEAPVCESFAFFDGVHPSTAVHEQTALAALAATFGVRVSEPATFGLMLVGVGLIAARRRALR